MRTFCPADLWSRRWEMGKVRRLWTTSDHKRRLREELRSQRRWQERVSTAQIPKGLFSLIYWLTTRIICEYIIHIVLPCITWKITYLQHSWEKTVSNVKGAVYQCSNYLHKKKRKLPDTNNITVHRFISVYHRRFPFWKSLCLMLCSFPRYGSSLVSRSQEVTPAARRTSGLWSWTVPACWSFRLCLDSKGSRSWAGDCWSSTASRSFPRASFGCHCRRWDVWCVRVWKVCICFFSPIFVQERGLSVWEEGLIDLKFRFWNTCNACT